MYRKGKKKDKTSSHHSVLQHLELFFYVSGVRNEFKLMCTRVCWIYIQVRTAPVCYSGKLPFRVQRDFNRYK